MTKKSVLVELWLEDKITIEIDKKFDDERFKDPRNNFREFQEARFTQRQAVVDLLDRMTGKEIKQFLISKLIGFNINSFTKAELVEHAINQLDPFGVLDSVRGEYEYIAERAANRINTTMSIEEIATMIAIEFEYSTTPEYGNPKTYMYPAEIIYDYFNT